MVKNCKSPLLRYIVNESILNYYYSFGSIDYKITPQCCITYRIKRNLWPQIPNPGESTIGNWSPDYPLKVRTFFALTHKGYNMYIIKYMVYLL